jgi:hypothetical protein
METQAQHKLVEWRLLAAELRVDASRATMPGLADKLIHAATDLEQYANGLSAIYSSAPQLVC